MTLTEFLTNPAGKGDIALNTKALASVLDGKYEKLMKEKGNQIKCAVYKVLTKEIYYIHLVIPTETERGNSYDVVVELSDLEGAFKSDITMNRYNARFFSNAPSFAYTYTKVYNDKDLLIVNLRDKFDHQQLSGNPDVRNRYGIVGYDKYLYFGVKYITERRMLHKVQMQYQAIRYSAKVFNSKIRSVEKILQEYHRAERKLKKGVHTSVNDKEEAKKISAKKSGVSKIVPKQKIVGTKNNGNVVKKIKKK